MAQVERFGACPGRPGRVEDEDEDEDEGRGGPAKAIEGPTIQLPDDGQVAAARPQRTGADRNVETGNGTVSERRAIGRGAETAGRGAAGRGAGGAGGDRPVAAPADAAGRRAGRGAGL